MPDGTDAGRHRVTPAAGTPPASIEAREFTLTAGDFNSIAERMRAATGIVLGENKRELVYSRLGRRLRVLGLASFAEYLAVLDGPDAEAEHAALVNAITTNLTGFFRERHHFETLEREVLPGLIGAAGRGAARRLRIWSAGCSTGEEPFSIAMVAQRAMPDLAKWDARILATDIDTDVLAVGRAGCYDAARAEPIPPDLRLRYLERTDGQQFVMADTVKELVRFRHLNLLGPWPMRGWFDVVFCRNVVIYFDKPTQAALFERFAEILQPRGWLFIGHSETLFRVSDRFENAGRSTYRKVK